eukprot:s1410_g10.t1
MLTHFDKLGLGLVGLVDKFGLGKDIEGGETIDWATAEAMSFASLLLEGNHVRITGQDVQRGTFAHRHCVENFIARNSILSEYGVLGFELGYSYENPRALVIWEAQFGDFANTAQVMVDQFVSAGEHKWLQQTGQGAEHSSCRLERFLQLSDDDEDDIPAFENDFGRNQVQKANWQVMNISTPANYFHALRRQQHRDFRKPMILASPKNLFRLRQCVSKLSEMGPGSRFRRLIPERDQKIADNPEKVKRLVFCSGKLYYELVAEREQLGLDNVAIVTLEQIAPFPFDRVKAMLEMYPNVDIGDGIHPGNVIWCQEEPKNMGAWSYASVSESADKEPAGKDRQWSYVGRRASASPATGYPKLHNAEQEALVKEALVEVRLVSLRVPAAIHQQPQPKSSSRRNSPRFDEGALPSEGDPDCDGKVHLGTKRRSRSKRCFGSALRPYHADWELPPSEAKTSSVHSAHSAHSAQEGFLLSTCLEPASGLQLRHKAETAPEIRESSGSEPVQSWADTDLYTSLRSWVRQDLDEVLGVKATDAEIRTRWTSVDISGTTGSPPQSLSGSSESSQPNWDCTDADASTDMEGEARCLPMAESIHVGGYEMMAPATKARVFR